MRAVPKVLGRIFFYAVVVLVGIPAAFSHVLLHPIRQPTNAPPPGYEQGYLAVDGLRLRYWLRRGGPDRAAALVVHGVGDTLESYVDRAEGLYRRGHTVLLLDLRGHGGSEGSHMTLGGLEREDVRAAMDRLRSEGLARRGLLLVGHSMGAVAVLRAAADTPDVAAVVVEAPFDSYQETVRHHAGVLYHLPRWTPVIPIAVAIAEWRAGFDADAVDAMAAAGRIRAPLMAIADGDDTRMPERVVRRVFDAHPGPKRFWLAPGVDHVGAVLRPDYWDRLLAFLDESGV